MGVRVQRLNGSGYMYSASNPPYVASAGTAALNALSENPEIVIGLQQKSSLLHSLLSKIDKIEIESFEKCPFVMFRLRKDLRPEERLEEAKIYQQIVEKVREKQVAIVRTRYTTLEKFPPPPQIKVSVMALHTEDQLRQVAQAIEDVMGEVLC